MSHQFKNIVHIAAAMLAALGPVEFRLNVTNLCWGAVQLKVNVSPTDMWED